MPARGIACQMYNCTADKRGGMAVGKIILRSRVVAGRLLAEHGMRCWEVLYAKVAGRPDRFHLLAKAYLCYELTLQQE